MEEKNKGIYCKSENVHFLPNVLTSVIKKGTILWYVYFDDTIPYKKGTNKFWFCNRADDVCTIIQYLMWTKQNGSLQNIYVDPWFNRILINKSYVTQDIKIHYMKDYKSGYQELEKVVTTIDETYDARIKMECTPPFLVTGGDNRDLADWLSSNNYGGWELGPLFGTQEVMLTPVNMEKVKLDDVLSAGQFLESDE